MLSKKAQKDLAANINRLQVCTYMRTSDTLTFEQKKLWILAEREATLYLFEKYGIDLPNRASFQFEKEQERKAA